MPGLVVDGQWVAPLEIADGFFSRAKGLLGRSSFAGALLLRASRPVRSVHTLGMKFPIDVAFCDASLQVVDVLTDVAPHRRPQASKDPDATQVLEAEAGAFARWGTVVGSQLTIEYASSAAVAGHDGPAR